ncbi:MAG: hypothetical protein C6W57_15610 [Caldibacillus debilis]|nr:MAG: hypothetical protein C6W57_15610 [Caldibacillus debilis]
MTALGRWKKPGSGERVFGKGRRGKRLGSSCLSAKGKNGFQPVSGPAGLKAAPDATGSGNIRVPASLRPRPGRRLPAGVSQEAGGMEGDGKPFHMKE